MIYIRLILLLFIGVYSCENNVTDLCTVTEKYDDGVTQEDICTNRKTGEQIIKRYFHSGRIMAIAQAKNGLKDGFGIGFYENGDTASILEFRNGKRHGFQKWFHEGYLFKHNQYHNDTLIGEEVILNKSYFYQYIYRDNASRILYHAFFDEQGEFVVDTGLALLNMYVSDGTRRLFDFDTLSVGDTVNLLITIAKPHLKNMDITLRTMVENMTEGNRDEDIISIPEHYLSIPHVILLKQRGQFKISVFAERTKLDVEEKRISYSEIYLVVK